MTSFFYKGNLLPKLIPVFYSFEKPNVLLANQSLTAMKITEAGTFLKKAKSKK